jgi:hypothetical protein
MECSVILFLKVQGIIFKTVNGFIRLFTVIPAQAGIHKQYLFDELPLPFDE